MFGTKNEKTSEPIKIGVILPLTGDLAALGEEIRKGIEIAIEEVKAEGLNLNVIYEDDQSSFGINTVNAANKLINSDKVNAGLTMLVEEARPIYLIFNNNKIPLLVLWDSNKFIKESGEYVFSNGFSTELAGESMADHAFNKLGLRKIAIVSHIDPWAEIISDSFKNKFEKLGGKTVFDEKFQLDTTDYRTTIIKIKQMKPDGVYFPLIPMNSVRFIIQAQQLNLQTSLLTGDALIQDVINEAGKAAEGIYFTNIYTDDGDLLISKYKQKYNNEPMDITLVSFGYDGIIKMAEASKNFPTSLKKGLTLLLNENRSSDRLEKIFRVNNGKAVEVK